MIIIVQFLLAIYKYILPLVFVSYIIFYWNEINTFESRIQLSCALILFVRSENCFALYRFYVQKSAYEYEMTIVLTLVKIVNCIQFDHQHKNNNFLDVGCNLLFTTFLLSNLICYIGSFIIILIFALVVLVGLIRGDPEFINPRRGLSLDEMQLLTRLPWSQIMIKQPNIAKNSQSEDIISQELNQFKEPLNQLMIKNISGEQNSQILSIKAAVILQKKDSTNQKICSEGNIGDLCSICLMNYQFIDDVIQLPKCNHVFHSQCIQEWLQSQPICPFCRNNIRLALLR